MLHNTVTVKGDFPYCSIVVGIPKSGDSDSHMIVTLREENHYENDRDQNSLWL